MSLCHKFQEDFSNYIDGDLPPQSHTDIEQHLDVCPECKETVQRIQLIRNRLHRLPRISTSSDFESRLRQRIGYGSSRGFQRSPLDYFLALKVPAMGFAIALIMVSFFVMVDWDGQDVKLNETTKSSLTPTINAPSQTVESTPAMPESLDKFRANAAAKVADDSTDHEDGNEALKKNIKLVNEK